MPEITYTTTMAAPRATVWEFVRDMNNWAPLTRGYQEHEVIDDRESIWTVKGDVGPISRVTKFRVNITEWVEGERVAFTVTGLNEPINGQGAITIADGEQAASTAIQGKATIEMGGTLGPVVNQLIVPFVEEGADELVTKIVIAVTGDETVKVRRRNPAILAIAGVWNLIRAAIRGLFGLFSRRSSESKP
jgi:carbon monoxide dehydrogenase subunit G